MRYIINTNDNILCASYKSPTELFFVPNYIFYVELFFCAEFLKRRLYLLSSVTPAAFVGYPNSKVSSALYIVHAIHDNYYHV